MINVLVNLVIIGVILYLVNRVIPLVEWIKTVINALAILLVFLYLLRVFGLINAMPSMACP